MDTIDLHILFPAQRVVKSTLYVIIQFSPLLAVAANDVRIHLLWVFP